jgi:signal transduction histidine kinase
VARLSFRIRLFIALIVVSTPPLLIVGGFGWFFVRYAPETSIVKLAEPVGFTEKTMKTELLRVPLSAGAARAVQRHDSAVQELLVFTTQRQHQVNDLWPRAGKFYLGLATVLMVILIVVTGRVLARQFAAPLTEIVIWTGMIERHELLPATSIESAAPEILALQRSLYDLQANLEKARSAELEAERLRAFGEVARRVAHEMKNPLTPIRLAVRQLSRRAPAEFQDELEVIAAESARLEAMAREFAELGRLPEGVMATVDLRELLEELLRNALPESIGRELIADDNATTIEGYYDPLRRVFSNVLRNAVEACHGEGKITVALRRTATHIEVALSDNGPGIPVDKREMIFQPYYTDKGDGTGLGLAIVRQTIEQHHGTIAVGDTPGGGATFLIRFPA